MTYRRYCLEGATAWLGAGIFTSALWSLEIGAPAWWLMAVVSPFVIGYSVEAAKHWRDDL